MFLISGVLVKLVLHETAPVGALIPCALMESRDTVLDVEDLVTIKLEIQGLIEMPENTTFLVTRVANIQEILQIIADWVGIQDTLNNSNSIRLVKQPRQFL